VSLLNQLYNKQLHILR